jgi:hypothetical protein
LQNPVFSYQRASAQKSARFDSGSLPISGDSTCSKWFGNEPASSCGFAPF